MIAIFKFTLPREQKIMLTGITMITVVGTSIFLEIVQHNLIWFGTFVFPAMFLVLGLLTRSCVIDTRKMLLYGILTALSYLSLTTEHLSILLAYICNGTILFFACSYKAYELSNYSSLPDEIDVFK